ncbi:MAG: ribosomal protein S18-alanine N-acetyltransferase [Firmicutes bacterium]|nr:ribosomal protein S18-alanine N-acetyltransferase [Bacillota bacterium]
MINVRKMLLEDIDKVMVVDKDSFSIPWSRESFLLEVKSPLSSYVVAEEDDGKIVGYGGFYLIIDQVEITNIAVLSEYRGSGIGKTILEALIKLAVVGGGKLINLDVRSSNEAAQALYFNYGFKLVGTRKGYYQKPSEDALLLSLDLEEGRFDD